MNQSGGSTKTALIIRTNKVCGNEEGWVWSLDHGTAIESMGISGRSVLGGGGGKLKKRMWCDGAGEEAV